MSAYRQIHTRIWQDAWFLDLLPEEKLLFVYLFSNERASLCGLYELSLKTMAFETGLRTDAITLALHRFELAGKVFYEAPLIWVPNLQKYNANRSPKVAAKIASELAAIPDCPLKRRYLAEDTRPPDVAGDTVSPPPYTVSREKRETRHEHEQEQQHEHEPKDTRTTSVRAPHFDPERAELERHFSAATRLPVPKTATAKQKREAGALWYAPLRVLLELARDVDMAKRLITETVTAMRNEKLTIANPNSILKVAQARFAANRPQPVPDFIHPQDRA